MIRMTTIAGTEVTSKIGLDSGFDGFFGSEYPRLVGAMYLLTGSVTDAEDLAQEALARVYERWERVRGMESPQGYAFRIALNLNRRRIRRLLAVTRRPLSPDDEPPDPAAVAEARSDVFRALLSLPAKQREALVLAELLGMTPEEIGRLLGIGSGSVRARLHRARTSFKRFLGEGYE